MQVPRLPSRAPRASTDLATPTVAPPQLSDEELRQLEAEASLTVRGALITAVVLYLCSYPELPTAPSDGQLILFHNSPFCHRRCQQPALSRSKVPLKRRILIRYRDLRQMRLAR